MAEGGSKFASDLEKQLTCSICRDHFTEPKTLPCLHTFCNLCINGYIESKKEDEKKKKNTFPCPLCLKKTVPADASELPTDFDKVSLLETYKNLTKRERDKTMNKKSNLVTSFDVCERTVINKDRNSNKSEEARFSKQSIITPSAPIKICQFASRVLAFSSQWDDIDHAASRLPGPPRVYPGKAALLPGTWLSGGGDRRPWVELAVPRPVTVTAVRVWETHNAGGVVAIKARPLDQATDAVAHAPGGSSPWLTLWARPGGKGERIWESRVFSPPLQRRCRASQIRIELEGSWVQGIDAVELEGEP